MDIAGKSDRNQVLKTRFTKLIRDIRHGLQEPSLIRSGLRQRITMRYFPRRIRTTWSLNPWTVNLLPTLACSHSCTYCSNRFILRAASQHDLPGEWLGELDWDTCTRIIREIRKMKPNINILGGEPLEFSTIDQLLQELHRHNLFVSLTTNGQKLQENARVLAENLHLIGVSYDGSESVHDAITGLQGSHKRLCDGLHELAKYSRAGKSGKIKMIFTICSANYTCILDTIKEIARFEPSQISIRHLMFNTPESLPRTQILPGNTPVTFPFGGTDAAEGTWENIDADIVIDQIRQAREFASDRGLTLNIEPGYTDQEIRRYYSNWEEWPIPATPCTMPWNVMNIFPNGDAVFCGFHFYHVYGNIRDTSIKELWNGPEIRKLRHSLLTDSPFIFCRRCCALRL